MFKNTIVYLIFIVLFSSCLTNKNIDIFQIKNPSSLKLQENVIKLKKGDLINVDIQSLTPSNYDFYNQNNKLLNSKILNPYLYGYTINDSGYVSLPVLGEIDINGKSIQEAEKTIKDVAKDYFSNPFIKIVLLNFNVTILGEVNNPSKINIVDPSINIIDAIGQVNGFTPIANRKKIKVIRLKDEVSKIYYVDLTNTNISRSEKFFLTSGDIIIVEPLKKRFFLVNNITTAFSTIISGLTLYFLINQPK